MGRALTIGAACGDDDPGPLAPESVLASRRGNAMVYDEARRHLTQRHRAHGHLGVGWHDLETTATTGPTSRVHQTMAFDRARGRVVLYGGFNATAQQEGVR